MKEYFRKICRKAGKGIGFLVLLACLSPVKTQAQAFIGVGVVNIPDSTNLGNTELFQFSLVNYDTSGTYTGSIQVYLSVDTTAGAVPGAYDSIMNHYISVTGLSPALSAPDSFTVPINASFRQGINTVVIWPRSPASTPNAFMVHDSLFYDILVMGPAGINDRGEPKTLIFPNPMREKLYVVNPKTEIEQVRIWDADGKMVLQEKFRGYLHVGQLTPGSYIIEFTDSKGKTSRYKAIKE